MDEELGTLARQALQGSQTYLTISSGKLNEVTNLSTDEVIGWLRDIAYTANETIRELEGDGCWDGLLETTDEWPVSN